MEIDRKYITEHFFDSKSLLPEGVCFLPEVVGLFRSTVDARSSEELLSFYGQNYLYKEELQGNEDRKSSAFNALCLAFKESDIYKTGEYEFLNPLTNEWEKQKQKQKQKQGG